MKIGIIVAMDSEMAMVKARMGRLTERKDNGFTFYEGRLGGNEVVLTRCGIGKVNAAVGTLTLIERYAPHVVVNTGVAGGTGATRVGDVVVATQVGYHGVWCGPGTARGQVQGMPKRFVCNGLACLNADALRGVEGLRRGMIASGDLFVTTPEEVKAILDIHPDAVAVDMESGAIAQVCTLKGVPFAVVRVVSDTPGVEDHLTQYLDFWTHAPEATFDVLSRLVCG